MMRKMIRFAATGRQAFAKSIVSLECDRLLRPVMSWLSMRPFSGRSWKSNTGPYGLACTSLHVLPLLQGRRSAQICAGFPGQAKCRRSRTLSFQYPFPNSGRWRSLGWALTAFQLSRGGCQSLRCPDICEGALYVLSMLLVMSGTTCWSVPILMLSERSIFICCRTRVIP